MNAMYIAAVINSAFRYASPVLIAALGSIICSKCNVFNVALEGQMLISSFCAIVVNYYTNNVFLSVLGGIAGGMALSILVAFLQITLQVRDMVVGTALNILAQSITSFGMQLIFKTRGTIQGYGMVSLPRFSLKFGNLAFLNRVFESLSIFDFFGYILAILVFIYIYKTIGGFHLTSVGIRADAAESLGIKSKRTQIIAIIVSGIFCGIAGVAQCMGSITVFVENMTAGRGWIATGAASMAQNHPLVVMLTSLFFGATISLSKTLQAYINSYFTESFPYICTVVAIAIYGAIEKRKKHKEMKWKTIRKSEKIS